MKIKIIYLLIAFSTLNLSAQVTIGSNEDPIGGALLDLKQDNNTKKNSKLGMKLPRVNLSEIDELYPMYGSKDNESQVYTENKEQLKNANKGLMVYNMTKTTGFVQGLYTWDGEQWMYFKTKNLAAPAISELICDAAYLEPAYYTAGIPFDGLLKIPYLGGNGAFHSETDVQTHNGLVFRLQEGQLANGTGTLIYKVTGTPVVSSPTTTTIPVSFLGNTCNITVGYSPLKELRYHKKIVPLNSETTTKSELYVGDLKVRYNYDASRNGNNWIEFRLDMPAHVTYHFDKNKGYATYGQYDAEAGAWYNFMLGVNTSYKNTDMMTDGNMNDTKRDISTAHIVIQRDDNRDVYRLTTISHGTISGIPGTVILYLERLETQINVY